MGEHLCLLSHLESPYTLFLVFYLFFKIYILYMYECLYACMHAWMHVHLIVAVPLEASDGPCLLSSQGRRQDRVVLIMLASPEHFVFCFTHAIIPVLGLNKLMLAEP